jgi:hypothetical protein
VSIHHAVENTGALCTTHQKTHMGMIKLNLTKIWFLWSITYEKCYRTVLASSKDLHCWLLTWVSTIYRYFGCTLRRLILLDSCKTMPRRVDWAYPSSFWFFSCRSCSSKSSKQKIVSHLKHSMKGCIAYHDWLSNRPTIFRRCGSWSLWLINRWTLYHLIVRTTYEQYWK